MQFSTLRFRHVTVGKIKASFILFKKVIAKTSTRITNTAAILGDSFFMYQLFQKLCFGISMAEAK